MKKVLLYVLIFAIAFAASGCSFGKKGNTAGQTPQATAGSNASGTQDNAASKTPAPITRFYKAPLYFSDKQGISLYKEEAEIPIPAEKNVSAENLDITDKAKLCIEGLAKGPKRAELTTSIPKATAVKMIIMDKDTLVVDLSKEFEKDHVGGSTGVIMTMSQLVLTLTELEGVKQVLFKIEGKAVSDFKGHISFTTPFKRQDFEQYISK